MPFAIGISFTAGRFHATPWGRHVNEGTPEWPPSPWRIIRALVAVWKRSLSQDPLIGRHIPEVLEKLASPPHFKLPPATLSHTRHYMPRKDDSPLLVLDSFVAVSPGDEMIIVWPEAELTEAEMQAVGTLLSHLSYLGRAESWCTARIIDNPPDADYCRPIDSETGELIPGCEPVRTLAPDPATWKDWSYGPGIVKPDPPWNILATTQDMQAESWSDPPGSRWLVYQRDEQVFSVKAGAIRRTFNQGKMTAVRFAISGAVLPRLSDTVYVGELARQVLMGKFGRMYNGDSSPLLSGKSRDGTLLSAGHVHAHYLPTDEDGDGKLDHLTIYAERGFGSRELEALGSLKRMRTPGGGMNLDLLLIDVFKPGPNATTPILRQSVKWRSVTPFIATRHYKRRGKKRDLCPPHEFAELVLREEVARRNHLPTPVLVTQNHQCNLWDHESKTQSTSRTSLHWIEFRQNRVLGKGHRNTNPGTGFEIEFAEPVAGPIALGYGSHFGLGLFAPV